MAGIYVEIVGNATQFKRELDRATAATAKANGSFQKMGRVAGIAGLAIAGGLAIGIEKSVKAAMQAQASTARLDQSFKNAGLSADKYASQVAEAEKKGRQLGFTNTQTRESLGSLITATGEYSKAVKIEATAIDVARFKHIDLEAATKTMTMAMAGSKRALTALGVPLIAVTSHMDALKRSNVDLSTAAGMAAKKHAQLLDKMATGQAILQATADKLHGVGDAFAGTAAGKTQVFTAQMDNLKESLGKGLLPALTAIIEKLSVFMDFLSQHTTVAQALAIGLGVLAAALIGLSIASAIAATGMSALWIAATGGLILAIPLIAAAVIEIVQHFDAIKSWVMANWPIIVGIVTGGLGLMVAEIIQHWAQIVAVFTNAIATVRNVVTAGWDAVRSATVSAWDAIRGAIVNAIAAVRNAVVSGFNAVVGAIRGAVGAATGAATAVGHGIVSGLRAGLSAIVGAVTSAFGRVWGALRGFVGRAFSEGAAIGAAIMHGIAAGIQSAVGSAVSAVGSAVGSVLRAGKGFLGIHSPSRLFADEIGRPIAEGIAVGIREGTPNLLTQMRNLSLSLAGAFKSGGPSALFLDHLMASKKHADGWVDSKATGNMSGNGLKMAAALRAGFTGTGQGAAFTDYLKSAKRHTDEWVDSTATANMSTQGKKMAAALQAGFTTDTGKLPVYTNATGPDSPIASTSASAPVSVTVNVSGSVTTEQDLAETIRSSLLRIQSRTGSLGFN